MDGTRAPFPTSVEEFDADPRIAFSRSDDKWILEEDNGNEWHYDLELKRWVQPVDQDLLEKQREAYKVPGVDESEETSEQKVAKKRKTRDDDEEDKPDKSAKTERANTAVYVTSIPLDATKEEINDVFSKYGIISESVETGEKRIKMYTDEKGNFNGEALIIYYRPESVPLAINMLDDSNFRIGQEGPKGNMTVQVADRSFKKSSDEPSRKKSGPGNQRPPDDKYIQHAADMKKRLSQWDDDEDEPARPAHASGRWEKIVVLKNMYTLQEIEEDPDVEEEIKDDIMEEGSKFGEVEKVYIFNKEPDGVATIKFYDATAATKCAKAFNGRSFDGRIVKSYVADGSEFFKREKRDNREKEDARLEQFGKDLEAGALVKNLDNNGEDSGNTNGAE
ncbi:Nuclear mRNA splicing factor-associated [Neofusicoccum parvum]|uniref:Nuclear mRNA splicing factor-associated n=1 Tax=Neofusicoccum parvum TaxID=310453 RepID=A0ACB5RRI0_9PEZI|nr:Nuclear mRNA splicing factor-associated [Neofusicoccum parvum]GME51223.1 Nuclear mRNA splicing factor-associated [Neofusicoccum parvum]